MKKRTRPHPSAQILRWQLWNVKSWYKPTQTTFEEGTVGHKAKWEYFRAIYERYHNAGRRLMHLILKEFCLNTGYHRNSPEYCDPDSLARPNAQMLYRLAACN